MIQGQEIAAEIKERLRQEVKSGMVPVCCHSGGGCESMHYVQLKEGGWNSSGVAVR